MNRFFYFLFFLILVPISNAQVVKVVNVDIAGTLYNKLTSSEKTSVTDLTVTGSIDARDFKFLRDEMTVLSVLNISSASISTYSGLSGPYPSSWGAATYPANGIPQYSFYKNDTGSGKTSLTKMILPSSLTSIGDMAFQYCSGLVECVLPESVKSIGNNAFYSCNSLKDFSIPDEVTTVGNSAFQFCHSMKSVRIGSNVSSLGLQCFLQCDSLKIVYSANPVPPKLDSSGFRETFLTMVFVPQGSVQAYKSATGWSAFNIGTNVLFTVDCPSPGSLRNALLAILGNEPLSSVTKLKVTGSINSTDIKLMKDELTLLEFDLSGASLEGNALPAGAFQGKGILTTVKLPASLVSIGDNAFNSCANLTSTVPLPANLRSIGNSAFLNCKLMPGKLVFPENLISVGNSAFQGCKSLSGPITFQAEVTSIGESAFSGCTGLTGSLTIPNSVTSVGSYAFKECRGLSGALTLSGQLTTISTGAFASCPGLTGTLLIPSSVTAIESSSFSGCAGFTELVISKNTTAIGGSAFNGCTGLTRILVPTQTPPVITSTTFNYLDKNNCILEVTSNKSQYQSAEYWKLFKNIQEVPGTYTITLDLGQGGTVKENNVALTNGDVLTVDRYSTKIFTIVPDQNFIVDTLMYNGADVKNQIIGNLFTTPPVTANNTFKVRFKRPYGVTVQVNEGGSVSENSAILRNGDVVTAFKDDTKTFTIIPDTEHFIDSLYYGNQDVKSALVDNKFTTPPVNDNRILKVVFKKITFKISVNIGPGGSVKENGIQLTNDTVVTADINSIKTFKIYPSDGYLLDTLFYNNINVTSQAENNQFITPKVTANNSLRVVFKKVFRITIVKNIGGRVTLNNVNLPNDTAIVLNEKTVRTFSIIPDEDYYLDSLYYAGADVKLQLSGNEYTIPPITADAALKVVFRKYTYQILIKTRSGGIVKDNMTILNDGTLIEADKNTTKTFTIVPSEGFVLDTIRYGGVDVKNRLSENRFTTSPITRNDTLLVTFVSSPDTFNIHISSGPNGVVNENGVTLPNDTVVVAKINSIRTFDFSPVRGYETDSLIFAGKDVKSELDNNGRFVTPPINTDNTLKVTFRKVNYKITVNSPVGGVVKENDTLVDGSVTAEFGTTKTFTFVPNAGYELDTIKFNQENVSLPLINGQYTTPDIISNSTLFVSFRKITCLVTVQTNYGGIVIENNDTLANGTAVKAEYGTTKTFTFLVNQGYEIASLTFNGNEVKSQLTGENRYTSPEIIADASIAVSYRKVIYTVILQTGEGGTLKLNDTINTGPVSAEAGTTLTFTIAPAPGYRIDSVKLNNIDVLSKVIIDRYTTPEIYSNSILRVTFKKITYNITIQTGGGGEVKENNIILANGSVLTSYANTTRTFTFVPAEGYELASLVFGGVDVKSSVINNQYTTQPITRDAVLNVTFALKSNDKFELRMKIGAGGIVRENNKIVRNDTVFIVPPGSTRTFTFYPDAGYRVASLLYDGFPQMALISNNTYTTTPINYDAILSVTFEPIPVSYTITVISDEGGVVKVNEVVIPNGSQISAEANSKKTFTIIPDEGFEIEKLMFDGVNYTGLVKNQFITPFIKSNSTLEVVFRLKTSSYDTDVNSARVYVRRSEIIAEGVPENEIIRIYELNGTMIYSLKSEGERVVIPVQPKAVYLVRIAGKTYKVVL